MAVGGGVILAASYEARSRGVRTAMSIRAARERCPDLIVVEPRMDAYSEASRRVFAIFDDTTPLVEPISIDEAFLDVAGLKRLVGSPELIATRLRCRVAADVGLAISVGVARTKFLAKVASRVCKPDGLLVVEPDAELDFLHPLPVDRLWGVGPKTAEKLAQRGITTVGDVAVVGEGPLIAILGSGSACHIHALALNRDPRPVVTGRRRSSIGAQRALGRGSRTFGDLEAILLELIDRVCRRLRDGHRVGRTVTLRFRFGDFTRDTRVSTRCVRQPVPRRRSSMPHTSCCWPAATRLPGADSPCSVSRSQTCRRPTRSNRHFPSTIDRRSSSTMRSTLSATGSARRRSAGQPCWGAAAG